MTSHPVHIEPVTSWRTSDGKLHSYEESAAWHQGKIDKALAANRMLDAGLDLASILDAVEGPMPGGADRDLLATITNRSLLVIEHWQCRTQPGYRVSRFEVGGGLFGVNDEASHV